MYYKFPVIEHIDQIRELLKVEKNLSKLTKAIIKSMLNHTGSQKEVDSIRHLLPEKW